MAGGVPVRYERLLSDSQPAPAIQMNPTPIRRRALRNAMGCLLTALLFAPACGGPGGKGSADFPQGSPAFYTDFDSALGEARAQDKPAVIVFSASWCPPCRGNKANVYPSTEVQAYHGDFVWAYLDTDEPKNRTAAGRFGVSGIPHIQFVDPAGEPIGEAVVGGTSPKAFAEELAGALQGFRG